ncbi:MAG: hypothetical protein ACR2HG_12360 [Pyrinomonadaceae bacterium]
MERLFQIIAVILIGISAFFLWFGKTDALFISAVLGAVCFFLSVRFQVKERMEQREKSNAETHRHKEEFKQNEQDLQDI